MSEVLKKYRCAIYTRKSHEEGLEQAFNSLDAQREAGVAYVQSQKHEGWSVIATHYDDGGYSGGSIVRPALQKLLDDVKAGKIDVIVVYKVDRLSRSINDFASMMTLFDAENVSFVSVTQQFNTTTSMGRLTLNMLLSFAQFEREVTGERIRDKITASKQKGIWMGGSPPLGYDVKERLLIINQHEGDLIKHIFETYLSNPSLVTLSESLNAQGYTTKYWQSQTGNWNGGKTITPKYVYRLLTNPVYNGKIAHKNKVYDGEHQAIISDDMWNHVHALMKKQDVNEKHQHHSPFLLKGKIRTHEGFMLSPSTVKRSNKRTNGKKRTVRYYISQKALSKGYANCPIKMLNAENIEEIVQAQVLDYLYEKQKLCFNYYQSLPNTTKQADWFRTLIEAITVSTEQLIIKLNKTTLEEIPPPSINAETSKPPTHRAHYIPTIHEQGKFIELHLSIQIKKIDGKRLLLSKEGNDLILPTQLTPNASISHAIGRAFQWKEILSQNEKSIPQLAKEINLDQQYLRRILRLINLSPDIIHQALTGALPKSITLNALQTAAKSLDWNRQRALLAI
jgi:DNA invertase Pin-like site-specific DNA recombinase